MNGDLTELCVNACDRYYAHLEQNGLAINEIGLREIKTMDPEHLLWKLNLRSRIYDLDSISIKHTLTGEVFSLRRFTVREYDADVGLLIVKFIEVPDELMECQARDVLVLSSLLFLVENVRDWIAHHGPELRFPTINANKRHWHQFSLDYGADRPIGLDKPSVEQAEAIACALKSPLTYVWGPPGTGKTRLVLTHAALICLQNECRVAVFAPTNLALEQAMSSIIETATMLDMDEGCFLRLGAPTRAFANDYPGVCEVKGIELQIERCERSLRNLRTVQVYRRGRSALNSGESMLIVLDELKSILELRKVALNELHALRRSLDSMDEEARKFGTKLRVFLVGPSREEELKRDKLERSMHLSEKRLSIMESNIDTLTLDFQRIEVASVPLTEIQDRFNPRRALEHREEVDEIISKTREWLLVHEAVAVGYEEVSEEELQEKVESSEAELCRLKESTVAERLKKVRLVGMTLDCYIGRFRIDPPSFDQIFLDEAGYAPLVKALSLFRHGTPVTMLGDHKQLPPILEMNRTESEAEENHPLRVWGSSAIFSEFCFDEELSLTDLVMRLGTSDDENYAVLSRSTLCVLAESRRFGSNLCRMLDELVYDIGFTSMIEEELDIQAADAPREDVPPERRESQSEADVIGSLVESGDLGDDFAILTPYRPQVNLLGERFPQLRLDDRILTIHRSQGREWDTVVLSVVDGRGGRAPWFTNTEHEISRGSQVMNTAVSRARRRLIVVCESSYWSRRDDAERQLISRLLAEAQRRRGR